MKSVKRDSPDHVLALLGEVLDAFRRDLAEALAEAPSGVRGLRSSQLRLLSLTPSDGLRVTDLAQRVGMTKQALGEFANALEAQGLLETVRDDRDRRARILRPTASGLEVVAIGTRAIRAVEERWRTRLGDRRWSQLRSLLTELAEPAEAEGSRPRRG